MWSVLTTAAWLVVASVMAAPLAVASGHRLFAFTVYQGFNQVCHQIAARSFHVAGHPLAVCARCSGLYAGFAVGSAFYPLLRPVECTGAPTRVWLLLALVPTAVDWSLGFFGLWANTHWSRFVTGALLGAVSAFYVVPGLMDLMTHKRWRPFTSRDSY